MKLAFHCSSGESGDHAHALANVRNLLDDDTVTLDAVAFVANGDGVRALCRGSRVADDVEALADDVAFYACANSMRTRDIPADDLLAGVEKGSSGVGTLAKLQADGYGYVKVP